MKRTIKFRAKTINDKWVEGDLLHGQGAKEGNIYILPQTQFYPSDCHNLDGYQVAPETIGQYTYFTDINGKPVYEGDVLAMYHESEHKGLKPMEVNDRVTYEWGTPFLRTRNMPLWQWFMEYDGSFEVIGNIYDNPKL